MSAIASDPECIFCKIAIGAIPVEILWADDKVIAFRDREPQAPTHILVIPKTHIASHAAATPEEEPLLGRILTGGYRLVINSGNEGGQTVPHLHLHLLGGRQMHWPPG